MTDLFWLGKAQPSGGRRRGQTQVKAAVTASALLT
jgi:hypothetical protein